MVLVTGDQRHHAAQMPGEVEDGDTHGETRHGREATRDEQPGSTIKLLPPRRTTGSNLARLPRHELRTAHTIDELLADERSR
jgi:hypothetical protein